MIASRRRPLDQTVRPGLVPGLAGLALFALAAIAASAPGAWAQDRQVQGLIDRLDRLQRELVTLQRHVYRGEPPPPAPSAPAAEPGELSSTAAARLELRLSQLEAQLRELTGSVEELTYRQTQASTRLDRLAVDLEQRLQRLEQGAPPAAALGPLAERPGAPAPGQPMVDTGPKTLGTISQEDLEALRSERVEPASTPMTAPEEPGAEQTAALSDPLSGATPDEQYEHAFGLLRQANYGEAERALRAFVEANPDNPLAGNAKYWLGETYYVRQDYQQAAITFAEAYQQYPDNSKAPDNLLKLGMSLAALGSKSDACGTFAELLKRYPEAAVTILQRARQEQQRLACP